MGSYYAPLIASGSMSAQASQRLYFDLCYGRCLVGINLNCCNARAMSALFHTAWVKIGNALIEQKIFASPPSGNVAFGLHPTNEKPPAH